MNEVIFDRKNYKSYKDFYTQIYKELDGAHTIDWEDYEDLHFNADFLDEFLWYKEEENIKYIFLNFDKEKIKLQKNYNDYEFNLILEIFEEFVNEYPNNSMEYRFDEEEK